MIKFVVINGFLYGLTVNGRFRKNWRNQIRKTDRHKILKPNERGYCQRCRKWNILTVHHNPPLYISLDGKKRLLCKECHVIEEQECEIKYKLKDRPQIIHCVLCKGNNFLNETANIIYCKKCGRIIRLKNIGEDEYTLPKYFVDGEEVIKQI